MLFVKQILKNKCQLNNLFTLILTCFALVYEAVQNKLREWNRLPHSLHDGSISLSTFKTQLKIIFISMLIAKSMGSEFESICSL